MPRLNLPPATPPGHSLRALPRRDLLVTACVVLLAVLALAAVALPRTRGVVQQGDDAWLALMAAHRTQPATILALLLDVLGSVWCMLPLRILLALWLTWRRLWWHLAALAVAVIGSEVLIGTLKDGYDRVRPPGSLVSTSGASFPSGHAVAASVTVLITVIVLLPTGRTRARWGSAAVGFSILMALSRAYLSAHWLSDAVVGVLVGTSCALLAALVVGVLQRRFGGGGGASRDRLSRETGDGTTRAGARTSEAGLLSLGTACVPRWDAR